MWKLIAILGIFLIPTFSFASTYGTDWATDCNVWTANANAAGQLPQEVVDGVVTVSEAWEEGGSAFPHWLKCDHGALDEHSLGRMEIASYADVNGSFIKDVTVQWSDDNSNWTFYATSTYSNYTTDGNWQTFDFSTSTEQTAHRYWRLYFNNTWQAGNTNTVVDELIFRACDTGCYVAPSGEPTSTATSTDATANSHYTVVLLTILVAITGIDFTRRIFAGKFGRKLPFA